jgi:small subunit ribosomal protein S17
MVAEKNKPKQSMTKRFTGTVVSAAMDKTVVVKVTQIKIHPKYHKRYQVAKKYHAHDAKNEYKVGDEVIMEEVRPISKTKKWRVISKITKKV